MSDKENQSSSNNRWWENYLVRYLLGSLVGCICVVFLSVLVAPQNITTQYLGSLNALILKAEAVVIDPLIAAILFLSGSVFCYIASTPITIYHATRVMNIKYLISPTLVWMIWPFILLAVGLFNLGKVALLIALAVPAIYSLLSQYLAIAVLVDDESAGKRNHKTCSVLSIYLKKLAESIETDETAAANAKDSFVTKYQKLVKARHLGTEQNLALNRDYRDTYSHLREHSNSVFIVLMEISLTALISAPIVWFSMVWQSSLAWIAVLFCVWLTPNVILWGQANRLESKYPN